MAMKKVCIYCEKWASGGIESFIASMLQHIDHSRWQVDLVSSCVEESPFTDILSREGVCIHSLSGSRNRVLENRSRFLQLMASRQYDVLHLNAFHGAEWYYLHLAKQAGIPKRIAHAHNSMLKKGRLSRCKLAVHEMGKRVYAGDATDLWACSRAAARFLFPRAVQDAVVTIPNGIDVMKFRFGEKQRSRTRQEWGIGDDILLGNTGRLCRQKNQQWVMAVFQRFLQRHPHSRLMLVGDGEDKGLLLRQADALGLGDRVIFTGITDRVPDFLCAMDVFLFPSIFEGLGIAAVEAQAAGLAVVCSDQVPEEAALLPNVQRLSLQEDIGRWVDAVENACRIRTARESCADAVKAKGYDMQDVAALIQNAYGRP